MNSLIYYVPGEIQATNDQNRPDIRIWSGLFSVFNNNVSFVDRSNIIVSPIRTSNLEYTSLPDPDSNFNLSFRDCAVNRAQHIYNKHLQSGARIKLYWSGGTDSSAALMSFVELLGVDRASQVLDVVMTSKTIDENPYIWEKLVRPNFNLLHTMQFRESWDGSEIIVNGEGGDQIHGTDVYRALIKRFGNHAMTMPWTYENVVGLIASKVSDLSEQEIKILAEILIDKVKKAPLEIVTAADFWWWLNFTCKWASVIYRLIAASPNKIDQEFLSNYFFPFYIDDNFQQWSMMCRHEKHQGTWESYKWKAKQFVIDVSGCQELDFKHRQGSLWQILTHTYKVSGIDDKFNFYANLHCEDWYEPQNSFAEKLQLYS